MPPAVQTDVEHVLARPDTYTGSIQLQTEKMYVNDSTFEGDVTHVVVDEDAGKGKKKDAAARDDDDGGDDDRDEDYEEKTPKKKSKPKSDDDGDEKGAKKKKAKTKTIHRSARMIFKTISYVPALFKIFDGAPAATPLPPLDLPPPVCSTDRPLHCLCARAEILVNAADNHQRSKDMNSTHSRVRTGSCGLVLSICARDRSCAATAQL
jgi:hypothetical protein